MPEIKNRNAFHPKEIANLWLATRKKHIEGTSHPGFFQTVGYKTDKTWVIFALLIEFAAVGVTIFGGITRGGVYLIAAVIAVLLFIAFDYFGSKLHHKPISRKQELRCYVAVADRNNQKDEKLAYLTEMNLKSTTKTFGLILIIFSALLKLVALFLLGTLGFVFLGIMTILYILAVYIHIVHTGYFLSEYNLKREIKKQQGYWLHYNMLLKNGNEEKAIGHKGAVYSLDEADFKKSTHLNDEKLWNHKDDQPSEIKLKEHTLKYESTYNGKFTYELITHGIFTDNDVLGFISSGNSINRKEVAIICLKHQLDNSLDLKS